MTNSLRIKANFHQVPDDIRESLTPRQVIAYSVQAVEEVFEVFGLGQRVKLGTDVCEQAGVGEDVVRLGWGDLKF